MANDLIVLDNSIVTSAYNLSLNEQRLIYCALKKIPKGEPIDPKQAFYITREDFLELGVSPNHVAREIRKATKELMKRTVVVPTPDGVLEFHWLSEVLRYDKQAGERLKQKYSNPSDYDKYINALRTYNLLDALPMHKADDDIVARIVFHERIVPMLSDLKKSFTQFTLSDVADFTSIYSYRIYQLLMQYKSTGYVKISLDDLRFMLVLFDKYPLTADLKRWVIDTSTKEINEKSPYKVTYKLIKKGRKFTHLELKFKPKESEKDPNRDPDTVDWINGSTDNELKITRPLTKKQADGFAGLVAKYCAKDGNRTPEEISLGATLPQSFNNWFEAIPHIKSELQKEEGYKKYIPILSKIGYKEV